MPIPKLSVLGKAEHDFYETVMKRALTKEQFVKTDLVIDVGCRNWSYVAAIAKQFESAALLGIELDGGRRYWNMHRRIDVAQAFAAELVLSADGLGRIVEAVHADFLNLDLTGLISAQSPLQTVVSFFFPFVSEWPCVKWGVPKRYADFEKLLARTKVLFPNAVIFSCHQGEWEAEIARAAYDKMQIVFKEQVYENSGFTPYDVHIFSSTN